VLVDVLRLRATGCLWVGGVSALLWPAPRRLLAIAADEVLSIDPARRAVVRRASLPFGEQRLDTARVGDRIVLLVASEGLARLVVVDGQGAVRSTGMDVPAGAQPRSATFARPGLAVDPAGARAFVVAASGSVAEISLDAMAVQYREVREQVSLLGRLARWLEPAAEAKEFHPGPTPTAVWLGNGNLALAGTTTAEGTSRPSGLALVDTRTWLRETLDPDVSRVTVSDGRLIAVGPRAGIRLFDLAGRSLYRRFDGRNVQLHLTYRGRIAATVGLERRVRMVSVESGKTTEMRAEAPPRLLVGTSG
jgi:hypothetical protein